MIPKKETEIIKQLNDIVFKLNEQSVRLRKSTTVVIISTTLNLSWAFVVLGMFIYQTSHISEFSGYRLIMFVIMVMLLAQALIFLYRFDQKKKSGDIIFEEASDIYEWMVKKRIANDDTLDYNSNILNVRIAFREYTRSSDLPFSPGKYATRGYSLINIMSILVVSLSLITMSL